MHHHILETFALLSRYLTKSKGWSKIKFRVLWIFMCPDSYSTAYYVALVIEYSSYRILITGSAWLLFSVYLLVKSFSMLSYLIYGTNGASILVSLESSFLSGKLLIWVYWRSCICASLNGNYVGSFNFYFYFLVGICYLKSNFN